MGLIEDAVMAIEEAINSTNTLDGKVKLINILRSKIAEYSPFKDNPVDCVMWVESEKVQANDYNPNKVAPPEMKLLERSIDADGYTQPIVAWDTISEKGVLTVIDGFHRHRVGKESESVRKKVNGYLPVVIINESQTGQNDRMASTIRHNRARGKHQVEAMSDIVIELKRRNWTDKKICKELGMDEDEVLRLCQMSGLTEMFSDDDFSSSWDVGVFDDSDAEMVFEEVTKQEDESGRIYHTFDKWECVKHNFYGERPPKGMSNDEAEKRYAEMLSDIPLFESILEMVIATWKHSCEHYLTNEKMNRIAWLGQASMALQYGIPARFRTGYKLLTEDQMRAADAAALKYLNVWLEMTNRSTLSIEEAKSKTEANIY